MEAVDSDNAALGICWNLGASGYDMVVPVSPLLAVLMSLQQGRVGVRSTVTFRYVDLFAGFCPVSELFLGRFQRPNTASRPRAGRAPAWVGGCRFAAQRPSGAGDGRPEAIGLADLLTPLRALMHPRRGLTQSFKRQPFQALSLRSVLAGPTPPPI